MSQIVHKYFDGGNQVAFSTDVEGQLMPDGSINRKGAKMEIDWDSRHELIDRVVETINKVLSTEYSELSAKYEALSAAYWGECSLPVYTQVIDLRTKD